MNNNVVTTTADQGQNGILSFSSDKNFAADATVKKWVMENVLPVIETCRYERQTLEEEWREIRRMVLLQHDNNRKYLGRSEAYIPAYAKARGTLISELSRALFPSEDYLDVRQRTDDKMEENQKAKQYIQYEFEKQMRLRTHIKEFLSQFVDFGLTVAKAWYERGTSYKQLRHAKKGMAILPERSAPSHLEGSRFSTRSVFYWYIWPTTVASVDEATIVFEDIDITLIDAKRLEANGIFVNVTEAMNAFSTVALHKSNVQQQQVDIIGNPSNPPDSSAPSSQLSLQMTAQECWLDMPIPDSEYAEDEVKGTPVPCKLTIVGDVIVEARRNPFFHQKKPYLVSRMRTFPGSFYPKGAGTMSRYLQYLVNDFTNQLNDNGTYGLNPVAFVNPNTMAGPIPPIRPGAVFPTTDPQHGVRFDRPPVEQLQYGKMLVDMYTGLLFDVAGAPPILQGTNAGKGARTATSSQILQKNASNPIQDVVEDMEGDVMVPLMHMVWSFGNQYRSTPIFDELGGDAIAIAPDDIIGDVTMKFLASSQAANQQQRAQQAMMLLQVIPPLVPLLQQNGKQVDPTTLIQRIYSDGFGFRNFDSFVKPMQPQMPGGMPGMPGQPPPGMGAPGENAGASAIPESEAAAPGEGEEFGNVRDNADIMAALSGMQGGV